MSKISEAIHGVHHLDAMAVQDQWLNRIHPLAKLLVTFLYIASLLSFSRYELSGIAGMGLFLLFNFITGEIPVRKCIRQVRLVLVLVCAVGIANPFIDRTVAGHIGSIAVTGGMISMAVLMLKGIFAVLASYLLIVTTTMEQICYALRLLHVPKTLISVLLLIYRYIVVLLKEAERMMQAYELRAPGQKGVHFRAWGTLAGQLLLRSIDRAQVVYDSMLLRGFDGEFKYYTKNGSYLKTVFYGCACISGILFLRMVPVFTLAGNILF